MDWSTFITGIWYAQLRPEEQFETSQKTFEGFNGYVTIAWLDLASAPPPQFRGKVITSIIIHLSDTLYVENGLNQVLI